MVNVYNSGWGSQYPTTKSDAWASKNEKLSNFYSMFPVLYPLFPGMQQYLTPHIS